MATSTPDANRDDNSRPSKLIRRLGAGTHRRSDTIPLSFMARELSLQSHGSLNMR